MKKKIICVDFDGVIHRYSAGWRGGQIYDKPVDGAIEWLIKMDQEPDVSINIFSSRSKDPALLNSMINWIGAEIVRFKGSLMQKENSRPLNKKEQMVCLDWSSAMLDRLVFPTAKPPAHLTIDDRAFCFKGEFPSKQEMLDFIPWNRL